MIEKLICLVVVFLSTNIFLIYWVCLFQFYAQGTWLERIYFVSFSKHIKCKIVTSIKIPTATEVPILSSGIFLLPHYIIGYLIQIVAKEKMLVSFYLNNTIYRVFIKTLIIQEMVLHNKMSKNFPINMCREMLGFPSRSHFVF